LPYHCEAWVRACFDPFSPGQVNHLKSAKLKHFHSNPIIKPNYFGIGFSHNVTRSDGMTLYEARK
jgi:hypothetical protein